MSTERSAGSIPGNVVRGTGNMRQPARYNGSTGGVVYRDPVGSGSTRRNHLFRSDTMTKEAPFKIAIVTHGDANDRETATLKTSRFLPVGEALTARGLQAELAVYHDESDDDCADAVRAQLMQMDGVLVWVNPIEDGRDRSQLDALLRAVAASGVFVSTHPDVILKLGTKEVLVQTRHMGWGVEDTQQYLSLHELAQALSAQIAAGETRVLKQYRGNGGNGVWKIEPAVLHSGGKDQRPAPAAPPEVGVRVRHARRGSVDEVLPLGEFLARCEPYFEGNGRLINQAYQPRLPEGMIRCYLVHDKVAGFGHQAVNALCPAPPGAPADTVPATSPRRYHPPSLPQFQRLKRTLETEWVPQLQRLLHIDTASLPVIWDCDFLLGPRDAAGDDTHVLCEINVSCVSPFPDSAIDVIANASLERVREARHLRHG